MYIGADLEDPIELIAAFIAVVAVLIILAAVAYSTVRYIIALIRYRGRRKRDYEDYRKMLAMGLMLGLEILVAADIIETVALDNSLESVMVLGLLVLIRTFLSWSLVVETEGRWPWQPNSKGEMSGEEGQRTSESA